MFRMTTVNLTSISAYSAPVLHAAMWLNQTWILQPWIDGRRPSLQVSRVASLFITAQPPALLQHDDVMPSERLPHYWTTESLMISLKKDHWCCSLIIFVLNLDNCWRSSWIVHETQWHFYDVKQMGTPRHNPSNNPGIKKYSRRATNKMLHWAILISVCLWGQIRMMDYSRWRRWKNKHKSPMYLIFRSVWVKLYIRQTPYTSVLLVWIKFLIFNFQKKNHKNVKTTNYCDIICSVP